MDNTFLQRQYENALRLVYEREQTIANIELENVAIFQRKTLAENKLKEAKNILSEIKTEIEKTKAEFSQNPALES